MAKTYRQRSLRGTSAMAPGSDIPAAMSAFDLISSALPPGSDVANSPGIRGVLTHNGSRDSHIRDTFNRKFQPFRYLYNCSGCSRMERSSIWDLPP